MLALVAACGDCIQLWNADDRQVMVFGAAMAIGPTAVALLADDDAVRWLGPAIAVVAAAIAVLALTQGSSRSLPVPDSDA